MPNNRISTQNLLLEGELTNMRFHTDMRAVFDALPGVCASHDWLISDINLLRISIDGGEEGVDDDEDLFLEFFACNERFIVPDVLITGEDLEKVLRVNDVQFVWAVFSALPKGTKPNSQVSISADGNPDFWVGSPKPQLSESVFEVVCFDSSYTLLISIPTDLAERFSETFPEAVDLDEYNREGSREKALKLLRWNPEA